MELEWPSLLVGALLSGIGVIGTITIRWLVGRSERRHAEWLSWRRARLKHLADALGRVAAAAERVIMYPAPLFANFDEAARESMKAEFFVLEDELDAAHEAFSAAAVLFRDRRLENALDEVSRRITEMIFESPVAADFEDGLQNMETHSARTRTSVHLDTAIRAAAWRIEELAAGEQPDVDEIEKDMLLDILRGDEADERQRLLAVKLRRHRGESEESK